VYLLRYGDGHLVTDEQNSLFLTWALRMIRMSPPGTNVVA
jgi:hypothetical protein